MMSELQIKTRIITTTTIIIIAITITRNRQKDRQKHAPKTVTGKTNNRD